MEKDPSPLDTLRQLKEWLDAGTITPQEFATLKQKLLFSETPAAPGPAETPIAPPAFEPTIIAPVEEPLLPPVTHHTAPEPAVPLASVPASPAEPQTWPVIVAGLPGTNSSAPTAPPNAAVPEQNEEVQDVEEAPYTAPAKSPLATILVVGGILALLALVAYLVLGNRQSERLTSLSRTAADSVAVAPEIGPQAEQIELEPAAAPETVRVAPALPPAATPAPADSAAAPLPATETPTAPAPAPPPTDNSAVEAKVRAVLTAYYDDLKAAPFNAAQHFAPSVERFYTMQNTTPAAIGEELARSHFPEFTEAETQGVPGTLRISEPVNDGSRVVTYQEQSRAFRQSLQKHQQTVAQVRVRLDKNFKIVYLRQEKLLENAFSD